MICFSEICWFHVDLLFQVGTGKVAAAWIGMFVLGIADEQYVYVCFSIGVEVHLQLMVDKVVS